MTNLCSKIEPIWYTFVLFNSLTISCLPLTTYPDTDNTKALADPARWDVNSRSWRYQTCAQVSYFNTAPKSGSLRAAEVNMQYHLQQCEAVFGKKMFPQSVAMVANYGGEFPRADKVRSTSNNVFCFSVSLAFCFCADCAQFDRG